MKKKYLIIFVAMLFLTGCKQSETMTFVNQVNFEYGEKINAKQLIKETNVKQIKYPKIDTFKIGKQKLTFKGKNKNFDLEITVSDSQHPTIKLKQNHIELAYGTAFNISDYVEAIKDPIDGDLVFCNEKKPGTYCVEGSVDTTKAQDYTLTIIATDKNNNETTANLIVTVLEEVIVKSEQKTCQNEKKIDAKPNHSTSPIKKEIPQNIEQVVENNNSTPLQAAPTPNHHNPSDSLKRAQIFERVNQERAKVGLKALALDNGALQCAADIRAQEIITKFDHSRLDGSSCFTVLKEVGISSYSSVGENIAWGQKNGYVAMDDWMNSQGHRNNILNPEFDTIAIGVIGNHYVQLFLSH